MEFLTTNQQALWVMQHVIVVLESWAFQLFVGKIQTWGESLHPSPPVFEGSDWSTFPAWCLCNEMFGVTGWCVFSEPCVHNVKLLHLSRCPFLHFKVLRFFL